MTNFNFVPMTEFSKDEIAAVVSLEQQCKQFEQINLRVGTDNLVKGAGDHAFLCYHDEHLIGFLSWYTNDGIEANINGMVHPGHRRQGVFGNLLRLAKEDIKPQGIHTLVYRIVSGSQSGLGFVQHLEASFRESQYTMTLTNFLSREYRHPALYLRPEEPRDLEFMVMCLSRAFGNSEDWTREYFGRTNEPNRTTYVAILDSAPVGIIRVNRLGVSTAFIHDFCVLPAYQGRGLGLQILTNAVKFLLAEERNPIRLGVVTENRHALQLYRNVGFEITSEFHYYVHGV